MRGAPRTTLRFHRRPAPLIHSRTRRRSPTRTAPKAPALARWCAAHQGRRDRRSVAVVRRAPPIMPRALGTRSEPAAAPSSARSCAAHHPPSPTRDGFRILRDRLPLRPWCAVHHPPHARDLVTPGAPFLAPAPHGGARRTTHPNLGPRRVGFGSIPRPPARPDAPPPGRGARRTTRPRSDPATTRNPRAEPAGSRYKTRRGHRRGRSAAGTSSRCAAHPPRNARPPDRLHRPLSAFPWQADKNQREGQSVPELSG